MDRALLNEYWFVTGEWSINTLDRKNSFHRAFLLSSRKNEWGPKPFRFFEYWLKNEDLVKYLADKWIQLRGKDTMGKLRIIKAHVKDWNRNVNGNVNQKIEKLEQQQFQLDEQGVCDQIRMRVNDELQKVYLERASILSQKARVFWQLEGDRQLQLNTLGSDDSNRLVKEVTMMELEEAVMLSPINKAPEPDGFSMGYFKKMWEVMKFDVITLRLSKVFHMMVSSVQSGSMKDRQASDSIIVAGEVVKGLSTGRS
ncbi:uncharacterized protein LOC141713840 [Apium graveolens]|uniref:uncharacterized protein LOC141713840 n=1 Tax=Apium graveolens TaxID=4045 RepID=UPI003D7B656B